MLLIDLKISNVHINITILVQSQETTVVTVQLEPTYELQVQCGTKQLEVRAP